MLSREVVVAQLVEGSLSTPDIWASNPEIGFFKKNILKLINTRPGMAHLKNNVKQK